MVGVMFGFFELQLTVFMPSANPYFMSDFNNLKSFEKKNTKMFDFDHTLWFWDDFRRFQNFRKKSSKISEKVFFDDPPGGPYGNGVNFFCAKTSKKVKK